MRCNSASIQLLYSKEHNITGNHGCRSVSNQHQAKLFACRTEGLQGQSTWILSPQWVRHRVLHIPLWPDGVMLPSDPLSTSSSPCCSSPNTLYAINQEGEKSGLQRSCVVNIFYLRITFFLKQTFRWFFFPLLTKLSFMLTAMGNIS